MGGFPLSHRAFRELEATHGDEGHQHRGVEGVRLRWANLPNREPGVTVRGGYDAPNRGLERTCPLRPGARRGWVRAALEGHAPGQLLGPRQRGRATGSWQAATERRQVARRANLFVASRPRCPRPGLTVRVSRLSGLSQPGRHPNFSLDDSCFLRYPFSCDSLDDGRSRHFPASVHGWSVSRRQRPWAVVRLWGSDKSTKGRVKGDPGSDGARSASQVDPARGEIRRPRVPMATARLHTSLPRPRGTHAVGCSVCASALTLSTELRYGTDRRGVFC